MMLRDNKPGILHPGRWGLIGGHSKKGEDPIATAVREICEETGIRVIRSDLSLFIVMKTPDRIRHVFLLRGSWTDKDIVRGEGQDMKFQSIEKTSSLPMAKDHEFILNKLRNRLKKL